MNFVVLLSLFAVLLQFCNAAQTTKDCTPSKTCSRDGPVCGELKGYKICKTFNHECRFDYMKCAHNLKYDLVDNYRCDGIQIGSSGRCRLDKKTREDRAKKIASLPRFKPAA